MSDDDAHWRAGLAQVRAQQILRLIQLYEDGEIGISGALDAIEACAQAILDGEAALTTKGGLPSG